MPEELRRGAAGPAARLATLLASERFDRAVLVYVAVCCLYQIAVVLMPIKQLVASGPLSYFSKGLAVLGLALLLADLAGRRVVLHGRHGRWLMALLACLCVSTLVRRSYGLSESISSIIWNAIQMLLVYTLPQRATREDLGKLLRVLYGCTAALYVPAMLYMFYQFATMQHYVVAGVSQGWYEGRLFGIMATLNYGSLLAAVLAALACYFFARSTSLQSRLLHATVLSVCFVYLSLSDSRGVYVGLTAGVGIMVFARTMRRRAQACDERRLVWAARGACAFVAVMLCLVAARAAVRATGQLVLDVAAREGFITQSNLSARGNTAVQRPPQATIASRRFEIWGSYLSILTDEPTNLLFGFSPGGLDEYIRIHYPKEYIVAFFKQAYPVLYARGEVYGTHNAFLHVLAVAGIFGLIALVGFLALCARDVLGALAAGRGDLFAHTATAIVVLILGAICFETDVFCRMTASSLLFWLLAGYAMHTLPQDARQQVAPSQEVRHAA